MMADYEVNGRRKFLQRLAVMGTMVIVAPDLLPAMPLNNGRQGDGFTFLFQGDSITDGNRTRDNDWNHLMGHGYVYLIVSRLWYDFPKKGFHFFNRGISGNKVTELAARWQPDTLALQPNVLSILIGINDITALLNGDNKFTAAQFEQDYRTLLQQTKARLPDVQLVLCEPFILPVGKVKEKWNEYQSEIEKRKKIVHALSAEFSAILIKFQEAFDKALSKAPAEYWIWDGIHPMPAGHELMAREWIQQVSKKLPFIK
jgi:lysophospholipase L1-like esterase